MKNDIFNMNRFGRYFKTDLNAAISNFGLSLLIMATMDIVIDVFAGLMSLITTGQWHGVSESVRLIFMVIFFAATIISAPSKIYGHITEKKAGTAYIMLPASRLEKYLSMLLISCIIVPAVFIIVYLAVDQLVTLADPSLSGSIMFLMSDLGEKLSQVYLNAPSDLPMEIQSIITGSEILYNPVLYIDDIIQSAAIFLLGALLFKKSKIAKTIGCLVAISMVASLITTPIFVSGIQNNFEQLEQLAMQNPDINVIEIFKETFPGFFWALNHIALTDTISDTLVNAALLIGVWFRLKKIQH